MRASFRAGRAAPLRAGLGLISGICLWLASACAGPSPEDLGDNVALCPVCNWRGDLACLYVQVDADTPRLEWNGQTYYFCSEGCRQRFQKDPDKYLP